MNNKTKLTIFLVFLALPGLVLAGAVTATTTVSTTTAAPAPTQAQHKTSAVMSPKCDETKIKELAGEALIKITKGEWDTVHGFNITLDITKMDFPELTKKMLDAGCF